MGGSLVTAGPDELDVGRDFKRRRRLKSRCTWPLSRTIEEPERDGVKLVGDSREMDVEEQ